MVRFVPAGPGPGIPVEGSRFFQEPSAFLSGYVITPGAGGVEPGLNWMGVPSIIGPVTPEPSWLKYVPSHMVPQGNCCPGLPLVVETPPTTGKACIPQESVLPKGAVQYSVPDCPG